MQRYHDGIICVTEYYHGALASVYNIPTTQIVPSGDCVICHCIRASYTVSGLGICESCMYDRMVIHRFNDPPPLTKVKMAPRSPDSLATLCSRACGGMAALTLYTPLVLSSTWNGRCYLCLSVPCDTYTCAFGNYTICARCIGYINDYKRVYNIKNTIIHAAVHANFNDDIAWYILGFSAAVCAGHTA